MDLYAVWKYDQYPFYLCAQITEFKKNGRVAVKGYEGFAFNPIRILTAHDGEQFKKLIKGLEKDYKKAQQELQDAWLEQAEKNLEPFFGD